ncbi:SDR family oxidoreductase [Halobacteriovorax sp. GB3]|uniref:SDR family oxidoreductase n=1 Tax=Halobacteriovorax sp. GB3 TaxID=2719615 RepID=UPI002362ECF8|nr:SDR family oxidoreductase [Halobacteriovorax sp. GB3]MDD0852847.1 SDR family oxidoreductase [Halobacteriovorax sp. GB3]
MKKILVTGATGFIGKEFLRQFSSKDYSLICLTRRPYQAKNKNDSIQWLHCPLNETDLLTKLVNEMEDIEQVIHLAAAYDFNLSYKELYLSNVQATISVVNFSNRLPNLKKFLHISTVAVFGRQNFMADEVALSEVYEGNNYEKTKAMAEMFVHEHIKDGVSLTVFRPGIVIASNDRPTIFKKDGPYFLLDLIAKNKKVLRSLAVLPIPYSEKSILPIVGIDVITKAMDSWISKESLGKKNYYHLVYNNLVSNKELIKAMLKSYAIKGLVKSVRNFRLVKLIAPIVFEKLHIPKDLYSYFYYSMQFSNDNFNRDFDGLNQSFKESMPSFIDGYKKSLLNSEEVL